MCELQPDAVISADAPSGVQATVARRCQRSKARLVSWVQDLYGVAAHKILRKKLPVVGSIIGRHYMRLDRRSARLSDAVVLITDDFRPQMNAWGVAPDRISVIPNWAPLDALPQFPKDQDWSRRHGLHDKLCFVYSGTLAMKHNPDLLLQIALAFREREDVRVVVVSEGRGAQWLATKAAEHGLSNLLLLPFQPFDDVPKVLAAADVLVAILEPDAGTFSVPSKVLTYLCSGRPLLLAVPPENLAARTVCQAEAGMVVAPTDIPALIAAARTLADDADLRARLGRNGRVHAENNFAIEPIADQFERLLLN